jgi:hypothetical protein
MKYIFYSVVYVDFNVAFYVKKGSVALCLVYYSSIKIQEKMEL